MKLSQIFLNYDLSKIEKVVAEYNIYGIEAVPYEFIKVKIYKNREEKLTGYTNIMCKDRLEDYVCGVGYGSDEIETLSDTINNFLSLLRDNCTENDFIHMDSYDF